MKQINQLRDWIFRKVHTNNLVYNTCWEDPRCDRQLMELDADSEIVMITSAGCNALDYLLDHPKAINCIDMNPRQNALLELKLASFRNASYQDLFDMFGEGAHPEIKQLYRDKLRAQLPDFAQEYWDKKLKYFNGKGLRKSFYHYSTSGTFAWLTNAYLKVRRSVYRQVKQLFAAETMEHQVAIYNNLEGKILNKPVGWVMNRHLVLCLVGVPRAQQELFVTKYENGAIGFLQECLRKVFTEQPVSDNYFYQVYVNGKYTPECCPSYLDESNFETLKGQVDKVSTNTKTISQFLKDNPGQYSHYVLLDHQDWLADHDIDALNEEWDLILKNSKPGTKILLRSAAEEIDFIPDFVHEKVVFEKEKTGEMHQKDRVGTYASVHLGIVQ